MLAILLYCDGECNYNLSQSQRDGTASETWKYFDTMLDTAIVVLSRYENHYENLYTGVCGITVDMKQVMNKDMGKQIHFLTNVSFTSDLTVAREFFHGSNGMIIAVNLQRCLSYKTQILKACDVSWISDHKREKEVLARKFSMLNVYWSKMIHDEENKIQWLVCDEGNNQQASFQRMFVMHNL